MSKRGTAKVSPLAWLALLVVVLGAASASAVRAGTLTVTSTADSGNGTLRWAMENATSGDAITFDTSVFPPDSPATIYVTSQLGGLAGDVTVDASNAGVIVDGSATPPGDDAFFITSNGNTVKGLQILHFGGDGVVLKDGAQDNTIGGERTVGAGPIGEGNVISGNRYGVRIEGSGTMSNTIVGNFIGTDVDGTTAIGNTDLGIVISNGAQYNQIGDSGEGTRNLISGNGGDGVAIYQSGTMSNTVSGNYIGTDASGVVALPNGGSGVGIYDDARYNIIGGDTAGERNVISGNGNIGVLIEGEGTDHNTISANYIGTDATGTVGLSNNGWANVYVWQGASFNVIGGGEPGEGNVISASPESGIELSEAETVGNVVQGNRIGTDASGTWSLGNNQNVRLEDGVSDTLIAENLISGANGSGVSIVRGSHHNTVSGNHIGTTLGGTGALGNASGVEIADGARHNMIGGSTVTEGNIIAHNDGLGVEVRGAGTFSNTISHNSIHGNAYEGIKLTDGGNLELPAPVIVAVTIDLISGSTVTGTACAGCTIEVFTDDEDEGRTFWGTATAGVSGDFAFTGDLRGAYVTATATDWAGNTSEFSSPVSFLPHRIYLPLTAKSRNG